LYRLDARLLEAGGNDIARQKIKDFNNIRELRVTELRVSTRYQLIVRLVNIATNNRGTESDPLIIEVAAPPSPAARPSPAPRPSPSPAPVARTTTASTKKGGKSRKSPRTIKVESIRLQNRKAKTKRQKK
jgi:hypothetical protein